MNIAICGFYGKKNFGDDLFHTKFDELFNNHNVIFYSDCYYEDIKKFTDISFLNNDIYIVGGGNVINEDFWFFKQNISKPIYFLNVSVSNSLLENNKFISKLKNLDIKNTYVRDYQSVDILTKLNIPSEFLPDIGLTISPTCQTIKKLCIVNLNSYIFDGLFNSDVYDFLICQKNIRNIAEFLDWLMFFDWQVKIIPLQTNKLYDDRVINAFLFSLLKNKDNSQIIYNELSQDEIIEEISKGDLILSTKYHSTVLAFAFNKNFIDITHHDKNLYFLKENNKLLNSLNFYDLTKEKFIDILNLIESNSTPKHDVENTKIKWKNLSIV